MINAVIHQSHPVILHIIEISVQIKTPLNFVGYRKVPKFLKTRVLSVWLILYVIKDSYFAENACRFSWGKLIVGEIMAGKSSLANCKRVPYSTIY